MKLFVSFHHQTKGFRGTAHAEGQGWSVLEVDTIMPTSADEVDMIVKRIQTSEKLDVVIPIYFKML